MLGGVDSVPPRDRSGQCSGRRHRCNLRRRARRAQAALEPVDCIEQDVVPVVDLVRLQHIADVHAIYFGPPVIKGGG